MGSLDMQHDQRAQRTSPRGRLAAAVRRVIGLVARRRPALGRSLPSVAAGRRSTRLAAAYRAHAWWRVPLGVWMLSLLPAGTPTPGGAMGALQAAPGPLVIRYLDVGDGDATWVTMPDGSTVLVDCGSVAYGRQLVLQLEAAGVERISRLALTNARANVVGGCADVIRYVSVDQVLWSGQGADTTTWRAFESLAATYRVPLRRNDAAQQPIDWGGGVIVHTLNPPGG